MVAMVCGCLRYQIDSHFILCLLPCGIAIASWRLFCTFTLKSRQGLASCSAQPPRLADAFVRSAKVWSSRPTADPKVGGLRFAMWYSHSVWKHLCLRNLKNILFVHICTKTNTIQCVSPEHSNDVTSCRHCWTAKRIRQLIFTPRCTSSFLLPAHSDISLGFMTWRSSSFFSPLLSHGSPLLLMSLLLLQSGSVASPLPPLRPPPQFM